MAKLAYQHLLYHNIKHTIIFFGKVKHPDNEIIFDRTFNIAVFNKTRKKMSNDDIYNHGR